MKASLPMYARPELELAHARYWTEIQHHLTALNIDAPPKLSQEGEGLDFWLSPEMIFSQTCGLPYRTKLHGRVKLVGTPDYGVEGCPPGYYRSILVCRADDTRSHVAQFLGGIFAFNAELSQSGYGAARRHMEDHGGWFSKSLETGGHIMSARAVAEGRADIAFLDAVSWRLMQRYESFSKDLKPIGATAPTPGLPYICNAALSAAAMGEAVERAIAQLSQEDRALLGIKGLVQIAAADYLAVR